MHLRYVCSLVLTFILAFAPTPAQACQPTVYYSNHLQDPDEPGIDGIERDRREARLRVYLRSQALERAARREVEASSWAMAEPHEQADWLVRLVVPDTVVSDAEPCFYGPFFPHAGDATYRHYMDRLLDDAPIELGREATWEFFSRYQHVAVGCNRELNEHLVSALLAELPPTVLSRVVRQIALIGFHPGPFGPDAKLFRYSDGLGSDLELTPRTWQAGYRPPLFEEEAEAFFNTAWPLAQSFWQTDTDAIEAIAAVERVLERLSDPTGAYFGFCPQTAERIEALAQEQRARWPMMYAALPEDVRLSAEHRRHRRATLSE